MLLLRPIFAEFVCVLRLRDSSTLLVLRRRCSLLAPRQMASFLRLRFRCSVSAGISSPTFSRHLGRVSSRQDCVSFVESGVASQLSCAFVRGRPSTRTKKSEYCREILALALGSPRYRRVMNDDAVSVQGNVFCRRCLHLS